MSLLDLLAGGGPLPLPKIPCAVCIALDVAPAERADAVTLAGGTLVCADHIRAALNPEGLAEDVMRMEDREHATQEAARYRLEHQAGKHDHRWPRWGCPLCSAPESLTVVNPEAIGDPDQTPVVRVNP